MTYKVAIFDLDGTLLDTLEDLADAMNFCLRARGMAERSLEEVRGFVGNGIRKLVERAVPPGTAPRLMDEIYEDFLRYYKNHCAVKTRPYPGIPEVLRKLKAAGMGTAVVSNKADAAVQILCKTFFDGLIDFAMGDSPGVRKKPCPDGVLLALERFGAGPREAVYVGDSEVDFETARNAGTDLILVAWGFRGERALSSLGAVRLAEALSRFYRRWGPAPFSRQAVRKRQKFR